MKVESKIESFLKQILLNSDESEGKCTKVVLKQIIPGSGDNDLNTWKIKEKVELDDLVESIVEYAQEDADSYDMPNRYCVAAFFGDSKEFAARSPAFLLKSKRENAEIDGSEAPNKTGLLSQLMRHNEANARTLVSSFTKILDVANETIQSLSRQNTEHEKNRIESFKMIEDLHSSKFERDEVSKENESQRKRKEEMFDKALILLPAIANRALGKNLLPETTTLTEATIKQLMGTLKPEQINALGSVLGPEQMAGFIQIYKYFSEQHAKEQEHKGAN